jgi:hypothetical protein
MCGIAHTGPDPPRSCDAKVFPDDHASEVCWVAAESLDEAPRYLRQRYHDVLITEAPCVGMVALLSGSPLDRPFRFEPGAPCGRCREPRSRWRAARKRDGVEWLLDTHRFAGRFRSSAPRGRSVRPDVVQQELRALERRSLTFTSPPCRHGWP